MDIIEYMPIFLVVIAGLFIIPFFISLIKGIKKDKRFTDRHFSIAQTAKRFEVLDGQDVVAFPCSLVIEPNKAAAIISTMAPGTAISDAKGNQYVVGEYLKRYSQSRHLFRDSRYYLVFSVYETGNKTADSGTEFTFENFKRENAKRKAAVKSGELSAEEYTAWLEQQKSIAEQ